MGDAIVRARQSGEWAALEAAFNEFNTTSHQILRYPGEPSLAMSLTV
jgi:hypothetical protein